ncbi:MAG: type I DNA topoisomerase [Clostridia bacterium]|nr:type I DNA topoisomerase [Clostridia bacterium]
MPAASTKKATKKKNLVIVESPAKAETIKKYLGTSYNVMASMGHLRDLPKSQIGIDIEKNFEPHYITIRGKGDLISKLKKETKNAAKVFLAADPDREGEAISWHLASILGIDPQSDCRITFNEITKNAVKEAITAPRSINMDLVDAQQARRVLDRIVGYKISPLLWKKVKKGLSAGRVQSAVTKLIVDKEKEIEAFNSEEYWTIEAKLTNSQGKTPFIANYQGPVGKKKADITNETDATKIADELSKATYVAESVQKSEKMRQPAPPFTTSTLQQEAARKLGFTTKRTMVAAQQLYEMGRITYMRTDSLRISTDAQSECRAFIGATYGDSYVPKTPKFYKTKKAAQDAHEAIRPTSMQYSPEKLKESLKPDLYKLYRLIWNRFVACQMSNAVLDTVKIDIVADKKHLLTATGSTVKFDGFMAVYIESKDIEDEKEGKIPNISEGEELKLKELAPRQHFTQPPLRYTEASLVKAMEEDGIGRPSTYTPTITTITARGYVGREGKSLYPTELGRIVTELMEEHFSDIVNVEFTANMEEKLDTIEDGDTEWTSILSDFYGPFDKSLKDAEDKIGEIELEDEVSDVACEKCGRLMVFKQGRFGKFLACPGYPECKNTKSIVPELDVSCPNCGGKIQVRKSPKGKTYYCCEKGRDCGFISWDEPTNEKCPKCGSMIMKKRPFRGRGPIKWVCSNEDCKTEIEKKK